VHVFVALSIVAAAKSPFGTYRASTPFKESPTGCSHVNFKGQHELIYAMPKIGCLLAANDAAKLVSDDYFVAGFLNQS